MHCSASIRRRNSSRASSYRARARTSARSSDGPVRYGGPSPASTSSSSCERAERSSPRRSLGFVRSFVLVGKAVREAAVLVNELVHETDDGLDGHLERHDDLRLGTGKLRAD